MLAPVAGLAQSVQVEALAADAISLAGFVAAFGTSRSEDLRADNARLLVLAAVFFAFHHLLGALDREHAETVAWKLFHVSFLAWFSMFLVGVLVQRNLDRLLPLAQRVPVLAALLGYVAWAWAARAGGLAFGNEPALVVFLPLAFLVFRLAFSGLREASERLRRNDVSYGVYIWHMPFVNQLLFHGHTGTAMLLAAVAASIAAATLSWFGVEKLALRFKRHPMHGVRA